MVLVAPGVCRFSVIQQFGEQEVVNILDQEVDTTGGTVSREEALFECAGDILNNWNDHIVPLQTQSLEARSVNWLDLNSTGGSTGSRSSTSTTTWPTTGGAATAPLPANVAGLVSKQIIGTRGRRNGRMYLAGLSETSTSLSEPNVIAASSLAIINTALADFLAGINDVEGPTIGVQKQLVVVHTQIGTPGGEPAYNGHSGVDSLVMQALLATQRGRLR